MKKLNLPYTIAILSLSAIPAVSTAQNSVTLYGEIDAGVSWINNVSGSSTVRLRSGAWDGSRFGFTGSEDLGGGYRAIFQLENGFDVTSGKAGQNGRLFGRQSYAGLAGPFGTITLGRQYDTVVDYLGPIMASGRGSSPMYDLDNTGNDYTTNNAVKFHSKTYGGWSFATMYAFGGNAGSFSKNSAFSIGTGYKHGPLSLGTAYTTVENPYQTWYDSTGASNIATYGAYLPTARKLSVAGLAGSYNFGNVTARLGMTHTVLTDAVTRNASQFNIYVLQGDYNPAPALRLTVAADLIEGAIEETGTHPKYRQYNFVADYLLSKRTDVYFWLLYGTSADGADIAQIGQLTASSKNHQVNAHIGIRHRF